MALRPSETGEVRDDSKANPRSVKHPYGDSEESINDNRPLRVADTVEEENLASFCYSDRFMMVDTYVATLGLQNVAGCEAPFCRCPSSTTNGNHKFLSVLTSDTVAHARTSSTIIVRNNSMV